MPTADLELLEELGFTQYERRTLRTLMLHGVADAETLCREGDIPSSKIYLALEKLAKLGLVKMQPTRPKLFSALSTDAVFASALAKSNPPLLSKSDPGAFRICWLPISARNRCR